MRRAKNTFACVMTSAGDQPSARSGHRDDLHGLMTDIVAAIDAEAVREG